MEENELVNGDVKIATIMNRYFTNITKHMDLKANKFSHREELVNMFDTFKSHKNVQRIKLANFHSKNILIFLKFTETKVMKTILNLFSKKATKNGDIPAKLLKKSLGFYIKEIKFIINNCIEKGIP